MELVADLFGFGKCFVDCIPIQRTSITRDFLRVFEQAQAGFYRIFVTTVDDIDDFMFVMTDEYRAIGVPLLKSKIVDSKMDDFEVRGIYRFFLTILRIVESERSTIPFLSTRSKPIAEVSSI